MIVLQTYWRRWLSKRFVDALRKDKRQRAEWERQEVREGGREGGREAGRNEVYTVVQCPHIHVGHS